MGDKPVMLAGHSLGGMVAASIASDPDSGINVKSVVSMGSPIARYQIPDDVSVLSVEHRQDAVPKLEGRENPGTANWTTITADNPGDASLGGAHGTSGYRETMEAMDGGGLPLDSSVTAFKERNTIFMSDQKVPADDSREFVIEHETS